MTKKKIKKIKGFKVWTSKESKLVPKNMFAIENQYGWFIGEQVEGKWLVNSIDTDKAPLPLKDLIKFWKALMQAPAPAPEAPKTQAILPETEGGPLPPESTGHSPVIDEPAKQ